MSRCTHCGASFTGKYPNMKLCLDCWQKREFAFQSFDRLQAALDLANDRLQQALNARSRIPPDMLRRLLQLAHPDKHEGSRAAVEATQWLLQQRGGGKA